ncbi:MAG TPA: septum formation initiator family protein [Actinobacteria bacterium]|nr:septum formation initiator family protein [Actinomycetota bacterium]
MQAARQIIPDISLEFPRPKARQTTRDKKGFNFGNFMLVLGFLVLVAFTHVYQQALVSQNGIEIARLRDEIKEEARLGKDLKTQKMLLKSPSRLERLAKTELGMVKPDEVKYIILPAEIAAGIKPVKPGKTEKGPNAVLAKINPLVR